MSGWRDDDDDLPGTAGILAWGGLGLIVWAIALGLVLA